MIKSRLINFLEQNKILSKNQYDFRFGNRENALYSATKCIYEALDKGNKVMAIFLDLAKVFDMVYHSELIKILPNFGLKSLKNSSIYWLISYLEKRKEKVIINVTSGEEKIINCGISQGSVLGPILFILFVNSTYISICNSKFDGQNVTYADDSVLIQRHTFTTYRSYRRLTKIVCLKYYTKRAYY